MPYNDFGALQEPELPPTLPQDPISPKCGKKTASYAPNNSKKERLIDEGKLRLDDLPEGARPSAESPRRLPARRRTRECRRAESCGKPGVDQDRGYPAASSGMSSSGLLPDLSFQSKKGLGKSWFALQAAAAIARRDAYSWAV